MTHSCFRPLRLMGMLLLLLALGGCASYGRIDNRPLVSQATDPGLQPLRPLPRPQNSADLSLILTFSGGGSRAAALSYAVLEELRDTRVSVGGKERRLLDDVNMISSVSGGSFTAAYYGLYGDRLFQEFPTRFLKRNIVEELVKKVLSPVQWFSSLGRTDMTVDYYEQTLFDGATFADMNKRGGPSVIINATDLGSGSRFAFSQDYFNLICSDLASFPVARAVTASSAVPVVFNPVVLENRDNCPPQLNAWLDDAAAHTRHSPQMARVVKSLQSYSNKSQRHYIHLLDGGLTDNLGLRAIYDMVEMNGGARKFMQKYAITPARRFVLISVDASTSPTNQIEASAKAPPMDQLVDAVTDIQIHEMNSITKEQMQSALARWTADASEEGHSVEPYFIRLDFDAVKDVKQREALNQVPTSLELPAAQVDLLLQAGHELLRDNPEFQRLLRDLRANGTLSAKVAD